MPALDKRALLTLVSLSVKADPGPPPAKDAGAGGDGVRCPAATVPAQAVRHHGRCIAAADREDAGIPQRVRQHPAMQSVVRRDPAALPVGLDAGDEALQLLAHLGDFVFDHITANRGYADNGDQQDDGGHDGYFDQREPLLGGAAVRGAWRLLV